MKRRLTIARVADQPARPAAARRADHRPRPAGPARAVGPAVPAQAAGRDAGDHHALHGRGRAAVRPAGGDGQGRDRRRGLAARADPRALHPRGRRAAVRRSASTTRSPRRSPTSASGSRCCPTGCCSTPTTARRSLAKVHERGLAAGRDAGAPLHAGGRLPPPHRPDAGGLMATRPARRAATHRLAARSTGMAGARSTTGRPSTSAPGRARSITLLPDAAALRAGDGRAARRLHRRRPRPARGRDVVPRLRRARADRRAGDADRGRRDRPTR